MIALRREGQSSSPRRHLVRLAVVLLGGVGLAAAAWFYLRPAPQIPGGDLSRAEPRVAQAIEKARAAVRAAPRSADAWGRLGMVLMTHEYIPQARECFRQAEARDPRDVHWIYLRAFTHREDDPAFAVKLLERAVLLSERNPTIRLQLADTLLRLGRSEEAERHYLEVAGDALIEVRARLGLARIALGRDDLSHAGAHARHAARLAPLLRGPVELLAQVYLRQGDSAAAGREQARLAEQMDLPWPDPYLEEAMRLNVGLAPRLDLAQQFLNRGRGGDAVEILEEVVAEQPEAVPAWLSLCRARLRLGQWTAAQSAGERALELRPEDALAWADLGTALAKQGQWDRGADCYRRSIRLNPHDGDTYYQLAFCQLHLEERSAAERSFRESVRLRPHFASGWRELGRLLIEKDESAEAVACLRRAAELAPSDDVARGLLKEATQRASSRRGK